MPGERSAGGAGHDVPRSGDPLFDSLVDDLLADLKESVVAGRCSHCGAPLGDGTGTLCQPCYDRAMTEIAATHGIREIWSEDWEGDNPTSDHIIWGVLQRTLDRRSKGDSLQDLFPILNELGLIEVVAREDTDDGRKALARIDIPHVDVERTWLTFWHEMGVFVLTGALDGPDRDGHVRDIASSITGRAPGDASG